MKMAPPAFVRKENFGYLRMGIIVLVMNVQIKVDMYPQKLSAINARIGIMLQPITTEAVLANSVRRGKSNPLTADHVWTHRPNKRKPRFDGAYP